MNKKGGNRATSFIKLSLNNNTLCLPVRICLKFCHFGNEKNGFKKLINTHFGFSRNRNANNVAAPFLRNKLVLCKLLHNLVGICSLFIHFINSNNNFYACCLSVIDSFNSLRHNTVICRNNQNCDIGCHSAPCTHSGECGVTRSIKKCNFLTVNVNLISTDCLSDAACLGRGDFCITDSIKDRGLTVVNVTHNANYRRSCNCIFIIFNLFFDNLVLNSNNYFLFNLCAKLCCNNFSSIIIDNLVNRCHHTEAHKLFDNFCCSHTKKLCKVADRDFLRNGNFNLLLLSLLCNTGKTLCLCFFLRLSTHTLWLFLSVLL